VTTEEQGDIVFSEEREVMQFMCLRTLFLGRFVPEQLLRVRGLTTDTNVC
jgi:hypothetical protein